jgi:hypothetical protein
MNRNPLRETLVQRGIKRKLFWSADTSNPDTISDELLIEQTLRYGDLTDLQHLFRLFDKATLRQVWEKRLAWIEQDYKNNRFLAELYFDIPDAEAFLKTHIETNSIYARLKQLEKRDAEGL